MFDRGVTRVGTFVSLRMSYYACPSIMQGLASQLPFLANTNTELAVLPLFRPVNGLKTQRHVALPSSTSGYAIL